MLWGAGLGDVQPGGGDAADEEVPATQALNDALRQVTRLTSLCVHHVPACTRLPALSELRHLQRLCLSDCLEQSSLPAGLWCSRLQELGASMACLNGSIAALEAAHQLQHLAVLGRAERPSPAFLRWAAAHPPLRQLGLFPQYGVGLHGFPQVASQLQGAQPQLHVNLQIPCPVRNQFSCTFLVDDAFPNLS